MTAGTFVLKVVSLVTVFFMLRKMSVYEYGILELGIASIALFGIFQLPGLSDAVVSDILVERSRNNVIKAKSVFVGFIKTQMILGVTACALMFLLAGKLAEYYHSPITSILQIMAFTFLGQPFRAAILLMYTTNFSYDKQAAYSVVEETSKLGFLLLFFAALPFSVALVPLSILASQLFAIVVFAASGYAIYKKFGDTRSENSLLHMKDLLSKHGKWSIAISYISNLSGSIRTWIIKLFLGTEAVALYAVAWGLISHVTSLIPLSKVTAPYISKHIDDQVRVSKIFSKTVKYQLLAFASIGIIGFFVFPPVLGYLFPNYTESLELFKFMLIALVPLSFASSITPLFIAMREQKSMFYISIDRAIFICILMPIMLTLFGLYGSIAELFITSSLFSYERYRTIRRKMPLISISLKDIVRMDEDDKLVLSQLRGVIKSKLYR
jgi:O-antigen/teichoic acid export membrane protein